MERATPKSRGVVHSHDVDYQMRLKCVRVMSFMTIYLSYFLSTHLQEKLRLLSVIAPQ